MAGLDEGSTRKVVVKKGHRGGHHGGAWKVAYADFVTTMMALFIVLWITGQSESVKQAVARYFRHPGVFRTGDAGSLVPGGAGVLPGESGEKGNQVQPGPGGELDPARAPAAREEEVNLQLAAQHIRRLLENTAAFASVREQVEIRVAAEGLRIELIERDGLPFFRIGSAVVVAPMQPLLEKLAPILAGLPNPITVEGHTDSRQYSQDQGYSNWELSADRANSARRVLEAHGLPRGQVDRVVGYADRLPRVPENPLHASNRRITLIVRRQLPTPAASPAGTPAALRPGGHGHG
jgi:chemotaxis protein MotB